MKNSYKIPAFKLFLLLFSFALAILDMTILRDSVAKIVPDMSDLMSSIVAVVIATAANCMALDWGMNKSKIGRSGWIMFGLVYIVLKLAGLDWEELLDGDFEAIIGDASQFVILAASYIFSGLCIRSSAEDIWNKEAMLCRKSESEFNELHHELAEKDADIDKRLTILEEYDSFYNSTRKQYLHYRQSILGAERAACNEIMGKTLQECDIDPSEAKHILDDILEKRAKESEKLFK